MNVVTESTIFEIVLKPSPKLFWELERYFNWQNSFRLHSLFCDLSNVGVEEVESNLRPNNVPGDRCKSAGTVLLSYGRVWSNRQVEISAEINFSCTSCGWKVGRRLKFILSKQPRLLRASQGRQNDFLLGCAGRVLKLLVSEVPLLHAAFSQCYAINRRFEIWWNSVRM